MYIIELDDLQAVLDSVHGLASKHKRLGGALGLKVTALDEIQFDSNKAFDALSTVIRQWISQANIVKDKVSDEPTWRALVKAVASPAGGGDPGLAKKIAAAHPGWLP